MSFFPLFDSVRLDLEGYEQGQLFPRHGDSFDIVMLGQGRTAG
jgi:hypothetical protein